MLAWSVEALAQAGSVGAIVVAAPPGFTEQVEEAVFAAVGEKSTVEVHFAPTVVAGGKTRAESVHEALDRVEDELIVIHDAARPLATPSLIDSVVVKLDDRSDADGVIAAASLADTVKRATDLEIVCTEDREQLWAAQTPQAFRVSKLREAYEAGADLAAATDEAMLIENAGGTVLIEPAPAWNLKVTTPEDLEVAELLLRRR